MTSIKKNELIFYYTKSDTWQAQLVGFETSSTYRLSSTSSSAIQFSALVYGRKSQHKVTWKANDLLDLDKRKGTDKI